MTDFDSRLPRASKFLAFRLSGIIMSPATCFSKAVRLYA